ncbi:MAG: efflux RND transporter periplasmic adaptor subunit, partial [Ignavibacteriaceae bacterium]|nr:efflux RND transporter periplasmic adaptor subunit [Ignavibacteriaceae bacterium]
MKIKRSYIILSIPIVLAIVGICVLIANSSSTSQVVIGGIVEVSDVDVASKIPGRIDTIYVAEGDQVQKGQILARLESKEMDAKVEEAKGMMDAAKSKFDMAMNGARPEEKEAVKNLYLQAKHQYELADKTWKRMYSLYNDSLISAQEKDQVEFQYKAANEQMDAAKAKYDMVLKGARAEEKEGAKSLYYQAQNGYKEALAYQEELYLKSPINGELQKKIVDEGEVISNGYPLFTVLDLNDMWVTVQLKETQMSGIRKGKTYNGRIPALGNRVEEFEVTYISPMGDFSTWKPTN